MVRNHGIDRRLCQVSYKFSYNHFIRGKDGGKFIGRIKRKDKQNKTKKKKKKNIEGKGEIARNKQFLLFSQCFHNLLWFKLRLFVTQNLSRLCNEKTRFHYITTD